MNDSARVVEASVLVLIGRNEPERVRHVTFQLNQQLAPDLRRVNEALGNERGQPQRARLVARPERAEGAVVPFVTEM